jgi:hypothetical protein
MTSKPAFPAWWQVPSADGLLVVDYGHNGKAIGF